jgi:hypothetical protein
MSLQIQAASEEMAPALTTLARRSKAYWGYEDTLLRLWDEGL